MGNIKKRLFYIWKFILLLNLLFFSFISPARAVNITLQWLPNSESSLAGYRVYSRKEGQFYDYANPSFEVPSASCDINNLDENKTYYFVVRAFDTNGFESGDSNEVSLEAASTTDNQTPPTVNNQPPTVVIAEDYIEAIPGTTVTLDGSRSTDPDDGIASYHWSQVDGPSVSLSDYNSKTAMFTAPETDQYGSNLTFRLTITDFEGLQDSADCSVYIAPEDTLGAVILKANFDNNEGSFIYADDTFRNTGQFKYADGDWTAYGGLAGGALEITLGGIDRTDISDMSGGWRKDFSLSTPTRVFLSFHYKLTQTPDYEYDELSQVLVSVDHFLYGETPNDYVVQVRGDGNGGSTVDTGWNLFEVDLGILDAGDHTLIIGGYNNKKTYNDESTEILIDDVLVKSLEGSNQAPKVSAGSDQTIVLPTDTLVLDATCTDDGLPNGTLNFHWSQVSGPGTVTFGNADEEDTTAMFPTSGLYVLRLTADDTEFFTSDDIQITVTDKPINLKPVVNAGSDQTITLPLDNVLLEASVTDDGLPTGILNTVWNQISGPANQVVFNNAYAIRSTATFLSSGTYGLQLSADDGELTGSDQVTVIVTESGKSQSSTCVLDPRFQQAILADDILYYTDRDYRLTNIPSKYMGMDMIKTPNDERNLTDASDYLTFEMPDDGIVYVAFDSRATSLPDWMSGFSDTGDRIYTSLSSQPYLNVYQKSYSQLDCVNLGANKAHGFSGWTVSNYIVLYSAGSRPSSTCILDSRFQQAILADDILYYTDRDYRLTNIPSKYMGMDMIKTPNDERNLTDASDYLTFEMPYDGIVYVAFDGRATSLPDWMSGFSDTGDRIYTSLSSQPYLNVYQKSYSQLDCVNLGANKAHGFSGGTVSNYFVFW